MLKRFKIILLGPLLVMVFSFTPALVLADCADPSTPAEAIQCGTDNAAGAATGSSPKDINGTISSIVNILSIIVGIAAVIMIIVGGFRYTTSGGKEDSIKNAKNTILYALIGLVIVALAQVVARFVLHKVT